MGVRTATSRIVTGDMLAVDGDAGAVRVRSEP